MNDLGAVHQTAVVRPGDMLILRVDPATPPDSVRRIIEQFREQLPDVRMLVIGAAEMVVYRSDPT